MARITSYYEISLDDPIECPCGWRGRIRDEFEVYDAVFDVRCADCGRMLLIVSHPTIEETKRAAAAGNRAARRELAPALRVERFRERFEALKLTTGDQLPELDGKRLEFAWDFEEDGEDERWTVVRLGGREIWREPAVWEGYERFDEVKALLKERYGSRFASLTPTQASELYLYGDKLSASVSTT